MSVFSANMSRADGASARLTAAGRAAVGRAAAGGSVSGPEAPAQTSAVITCGLDG